VGEVGVWGVSGGVRGNGERGDRRGSGRGKDVNGVSRKGTEAGGGREKGLKGEDEEREEKIGGGEAVGEERGLQIVDREG